MAFYPQRTKNSACITTNTAHESLLWLISLFVVALSLVEFVKKMWFIKLPRFVVTLGAFVKCFCESSSFPQKCIRSYIGCIWSWASQENRIRFVNLMVCFDLLSPKFLIMRARQLKKEEQNGISMVVTCMPEKVKIKSISTQISLTAAAGCWQQGG